MISYGRCQGKFVGDENDIALLIGPILASRFRFKFIEAAKELQDELGEHRAPEFQLACRQLLYDIERMEQEFERIWNEQSVFQEAFGQENYEIVNVFI